MKNPPDDLNGYDPTKDADAFYWDAEEASRACEFFPDMLCHTKGHDGPFRLEPWQQNVVGTLFGWRNKSNGTRRYREAIIEVPRKNGKTNLASGIALYGLLCDKEPGAEVYCAAYSREQATLVFEPAAYMARMNDDIAKIVNVIDSTKRIVAGNCVLRAIPAEAAGSHGFNAHLVVFDELHTQRNRELYDVLRTSQSSRSKAAEMRGRGGPLFISITTAGHDRNSICWEVVEYARKVRSGVIPDPHFLPVIYEAATDADWTSEEVWQAVNPNLGVSVSLDFLREECRRAKEVPAYENTFRNLYLNQWTQSAVRWFSLNDWDACEGELPFLTGAPCWSGLDMSSTQDVTAFVMAFPLTDGFIALVPHFWIPEESAMAKERSDRVPYRLWNSQGLVTFTNGATVDYDKVRLDINKLRDQYAINEIAADRWNATQIINQLSQDGFNMVAHGQGIASMTGPCKQFETLVFSHKLVHGGHPVLRWMADNVMVETDAAENKKPTKAKSTGRIDGIVAAVMAVGRAVVANPAPTGNLFVCLED